MNIHHLELFFYVAKHRGISEAVRNMPYGIQQPAVSAQIIQLEEFLGTTLFHRRPFSLTPAGEELFGFIRPFFENLQPLAEKLRSGGAQHIRIGASEVVLRDHLPPVLQEVRKQIPNLKVTLREGYQPELETCIRNRELDMAITLLEGKPPPGAHAIPLFKLPLVLLVKKECSVHSLKQLWTQDPIKETLISLPTQESIYRNFQQGLQKLKVDWFSGIEVSTVELVETYVANGYGIGLSIAIPRAELRPDLRALPLEDFEPVSFGVLWQGQETPVMRAILGAIQSAAELVRS